MSKLKKCIMFNKFWNSFTFDKLLNFENVHTTQRRSKTHRPLQLRWRPEHMRQNACATFRHVGVGAAHPVWPPLRATNLHFETHSPILENIIDRFNLEQHKINVKTNFETFGRRKINVVRVKNKIVTRSAQRDILKTESRRVQFSPSTPRASLVLEDVSGT